MQYTRNGDRLLDGDFEHYGRVRAGGMGHAALRAIHANPNITQHALASLLKREGWATGGYGSWLGMNVTSKLWGSGLLEMVSTQWGATDRTAMCNGTTYKREFTLSVKGVLALTLMEAGTTVTCERRACEWLRAAA